jgi:glycosyltransferase involved in cell wall biosynthesis
VRRYRYAPRTLETLAYSGTMLAQAALSPGAVLAFGGLVSQGLAAALSEASRRRASLLHAHWWFPGGLVGSAARGIQSIPLVTTLHGSDVRAARSSALATSLFRRVLTHSTAVTTVSRWLADEARAIEPSVDPVVAPMPVLPGLFRPGRDRSRERLLFVGKLNEQKGIAHLLRALAQSATRPSLDVVVGVGSSADDLKPLASSLGVLDRITFHPLLPQHELAVLYQRALALVAPFTDEGLGLVAIEAALSGTPTIAFASGGLTDIVLDERTGVLVPPGDDAALAAAIDRIVQAPELARSLGNAAREHALATFAPDAVARRYGALYKSLVSAGRSGMAQ